MRIKLVSVALVLLVAGLSACGSPSQDRPASPGAASSPAPVVLVTIDTLRADRLSDDGPMPRLRELASRGYRFTTVHTPVPMTLPAHVTIMTGLGLQHHGVRDNIGYALSPDVPTIAEAFSASGWATAAFVGGYPLDHVFGLARGFDLYDDTMTRTPADGREGHTERRADEVVDAALGWLAGRGDKSFFLWVHVFDVHDPYEAPAPFGGRHAEPYDDEVAYTDDVLGRLFDALMKREGQAPWIVVTSDHGEALGEHGETTHGVFLYDSTIRVPLVIVPPGGAALPRVLDAPVSLSDIAPTILEAAGLPSLDYADGLSLMNELQAEGGERLATPRPLYLESVHGRQRYGWAPLAGFLEWPQKYVSAPRPELFDLGRDPLERENLFDRANARELAIRLDEIRAPDEEFGAATDPGIEVDLERLNSLGYVGGSGVAQPEDALFEGEWPDPKDRIAAIPEIDRGLVALAAGRQAEARRAFEAALSLDPDNLLALNDLGLLALRSGDVSRAEGYFREVLRKDERAETTANNLGLALGYQNRFAEAADVFRQALAVRPGFTMARFNLAFVLHQQGSSREALRELERVQSEDPGFPGLAGFMGEVQRAARSTR